MLIRYLWCIILLLNANLFAQDFRIEKVKANKHAAGPTYYTIAINKNRFDESSTIREVKNYFDSLSAKPFTTGVAWYNKKDTTQILFFAYPVQNKKGEIVMGNIIEYSNNKCAFYNPNFPIASTNQIPASMTGFYWNGNISLKITYNKNGTTNSIKYYTNDEKLRYQWKFMMKMEI